jgi:plasmid stabilization system protein ParE
MQLQWTNKAQSDLMRVYDFLSAVNIQAATSVIQKLINAPLRLLEQPRLGERLSKFEPREVRRILIGQYEMRYEIQLSMIYILRIWHTREQR